MKREFDDTICFIVFKHITYTNGIIIVLGMSCHIILKLGRQKFVFKCIKLI